MASQRGCWPAGRSLYNLVLTMKLVLSTCPPDAAEGLARGLLDARLAACVSVLPQINSLYWWEGKVTADTEALLLIKTEDALVEELCAVLRERHPYDVPEILYYPVECGNPDYLEWVAGEVKAPGGAAPRA